MATEDEEGAARAFETLRAEVTVMRRAVEALEAKKPIDYAPTLGAIVRELEGLKSASTAMARQPGVALTPETYAYQMHRAQEAAARPVSIALADAKNLAVQLDGTLGGVWTREHQRRRMLQAAGGGLAAGAVLLALLAPLVARALPDGWHVPERVAAGFVGGDRWTVGQRMLRSVNEKDFNRVAWAVGLERENRKALDACARKAVRTKREQRCTIQVSLPPAPSFVLETDAVSNQQPGS